MPTNREKLLSLIQNRAFIRGEVKLSSGQKSDFYVDGKMIEMHPMGAYLIGEALFEQIEGMGVNAVGGLAIGAVPLVASLAVSCHLHGREDIEGFFVREEAKAHGTMKTIEGKLPPHARVVIVDDVVTSGKSVLKAVEAVEEQGATVVAIVAVVDREAGAKELFVAKGYRYESVFTKQDVLGYVNA